ncbi:MAG: hypothetical protein Q9186_006545 [Xanthomendoza sp. 1 TL-2023]
MFYGDGSDLINNFVGSYEVVGHELTHGIVQFSSGLLYEGQPGAPNEYVSDVMGTLFEQWVNGVSADKADWLLSQDVLLPDNPKVAMRSMKAPGTAYDDHRLGRDTQRAHMRNFLHTPFDHGGVHTNSGIPQPRFLPCCHPSWRQRMGGPRQDPVCSNDNRDSEGDVRAIRRENSARSEEGDSASELASHRERGVD